MDTMSADGLAVAGLRLAVQVMEAQQAEIDSLRLTVRALGEETDRACAERDGLLVPARRLRADLRRMDAEQAIELAQWPAARDLIVAVERAQ